MSLELKLSNHEELWRNLFSRSRHSAPVTNSSWSHNGQQPYPDWTRIVGAQEMTRCWSAYGDSTTLTPVRGRCVRGAYEEAFLMNLHLCRPLHVAVWFCAFPSFLWAQDNSHKLTAMDEFQIQIAADPQISPDGKRIG